MLIKEEYILRRSIKQIFVRQNKTKMQICQNLCKHTKKLFKMTDNFRDN